MDRPDNDLIRAHLHGDNEAFPVLYERYKRQVYSFLLKMLADECQAVDDVFQQAWLKAVKHLHRYRNQDRFLAWIVSIARNTALDHFRKIKKDYVLDELDRDNAPEVENTSQEEPWRNMDRTELLKAVQDALKCLSSQQREVFVMRQEGMSFKEISKIHKCSINTALARMQYAMKNLQKELVHWKEQRR